MRDLHRSHLELASASLDWGLSDDEHTSLRGHLASCTSCRRLVHELRVDAADLAAAPVMRLPAPAAAALRNRLARRHRHRTPSSVQLVFVAALLALLALGAVAVGAELLRRAPSEDLVLVPPPSSSPPPSLRSPETTPGPSSLPSDLPSRGPDGTWRPASSDPLPAPAGPSGPRLARAEAAAMFSAGTVIVGCLEEPQDVGSPLCTAPAAWRSDDGVTWEGPALLPTAQDPGSFASATAVTMFRDRLVAVGATTQDRVLAPAAWTSIDGSDWTAATLEGTAATTLRGLAIHNGRIVAVGGNDSGPFAWHSQTGTDWSRADFSGGDARAPLSGVFRTGSDGLIAWGSAGDSLAPTMEWWTSGDGVEWARAEPPPGLESGVVAMHDTNDAKLAVGTVIDADGFRPGVWTRPHDDERWEPSEPWWSAGLAPTAVLAVDTGAVAAAYVDIEDRVAIWLQEPGGPWRSSSVIDGLRPVALFGDRRQIANVSLVGQTGSGETVVWTGRLPWWE